MTHVFTVNSSFWFIGKNIFGEKLVLMELKRIGYYIEEARMFSNHLKRDRICCLALFDSRSTTIVWQFQELPEDPRQNDDNFDCSPYRVHPHID